MSLWTSSVISLLLLQTVQAHAQQANEDNRPVTVEEVAAAEDAPPRMVLIKKDWNLTRAYSDVFKILSNRNSCSSFYGGPRPATTVLNDFFALVRIRTLSREVSFQMAGRPHLFRDAATGARYRLFDRS